MVSQNVNKLLQAVESLTDAERDELRRLLDERARRQGQLAPEERVRQALVERGMLEERPPSGKDPERFRRWSPIRVEGEPLSETIVEERR